MRMLRASVVDSYHVHKTLLEAAADCGLDTKLFEGTYETWINKLSDLSYHYVLMLHGKKVVGMVWGRELHDEPKKTILVEGRFLRRAYRGKLKFSRRMVECIETVVKDFDVVRMILPPNRDKLPGKYRALGTLVERVA